MSDLPPRAVANVFVRAMTADRYAGLFVQDAYDEYKSWAAHAGVALVPLRVFRRELINAGWRWPRQDGKRDMLQLTR